MLNGTVKWFNNKKGYGFIQTPDSEKDIFVHITAVQESGLERITEGQKISFEIIPDRSGRPEAHHLSILNN